MLDRQQTIANLVLDHSECSAVLERHHIDFCCRGNLSIEAAAKAKQLDPNALVDELSRAIQSRTVTPPVDARRLPTKELCAHIVSTHHEYTRTALPVVRSLAAKVSRVHGDRNPKLRELAGAVEALATTLLPHMVEEEQELFPLLTAPTADSAETSKRLAAMKKEHLAVAALLERIRSCRALRRRCTGDAAGRRSFAQVGCFAISASGSRASRWMSSPIVSSGGASDCAD